MPDQQFTCQAPLIKKKYRHKLKTTQLQKSNDSQCELDIIKQRQISKMFIINLFRYQHKNGSANFHIKKTTLSPCAIKTIQKSQSVIPIKIYIFRYDIIFPPKNHFRSSFSTYCQILGPKNIINLNIRKDDHTS